MRLIRGILAAAAVAALWTWAYRAGARSGSGTAVPPPLALPAGRPDLPPPDAPGAWLALAIQARAPEDGVRVVLPSFAARPRLAGPVGDRADLERAANACFRKRLDREAMPR